MLLPLAAGAAAASARRAGADLVVRSLAAPTRPQADGTVLVRDSIRNVGKQRASASKVGYFLAQRRTTTARGTPRFVIGSRRVPRLGPREASARTTRISLRPGLAAGRYFLVACADALGQLDERLERNNCRLARRPLVVNERVKRGVNPPAPPTLLARPPDPTNTKEAAFEFAGGKEVTFHCSLDGRPFTRCGSPATYSGLAEGRHSFAVKAVAAQGRESSPVTYAWRVDLTPPPVPVFESRPEPLTNSRRASFEFVSEEAASYFCSLDGAPAVPCATPRVYEALGEGAHTFAVYSRDLAGNAGDSAVVTWTIDITPPAAPTFTSLPPDPTASATASFKFEGEANATFSCSVDGGPFAACSSPHRVGPLGGGRHNISVKPHDRAGNEGTPALFPWTVLDLGVFVGTADASAVAPFATWLGRPISRVLAYFGYASWYDIENPPEVDVWKGRGYRMVYSVPMLPASEGSLQSGAAGDYNGHFVALARRLVDTGQADSVIRLGWEFNGFWYPWTAKDDPTAFAAYWRQIVRAMRSVPGARFTFDWCTVLGPASVDADKAYPGDDYVDHIGISAFDQDWYPGWEDPRLRWQNFLNLPFGLRWQRDFGLRHGKPVVIDEWGLSIRSDDHGGGDNPYYIEQMVAWSTATRAAWALYFEFDNLDGHHSLMSGQFPLGAQRFRELLGS